MRRRALPVALATALLAVFSAGTLSVEAQTASTITVSNATANGGIISVSGTVALGPDVLGPTEVWSDPSGDAVVAGIGLDMTKGTIATNLATNRLVFAVSTSDGLPAPVDGPPPAAGFQWPVSVNGEDLTRWLGAGTAGSGNRTAEWTGLCHNQTSTGGWDCAQSVTGSVTGTGVTWSVSFGQIPNGVTHGSTIDSGAILCGIPCSIAWPPGLIGALSPIDTGGFPGTYVVPGKIQLGIAPAGTPAGSVTFTNTGTLVGSSSTFTGEVSRPSLPGAYTVYVKTCGGLQDALTCAVGTKDITL